jgi:hypothetical protein
MRMANSTLAQRKNEVKIKESRGTAAVCRDEFGKFIGASVLAVPESQTQPF